MKPISIVLAAALATSASIASAATLNSTNTFGTQPSLVGSLDVTEVQSGIAGTYFYNVTNNTGGAILAFGVSNNSSNSQAALFGNGGRLPDDGFCARGETGGERSVCYGAQVITEQDWTNTTAFFSDTGAVNFEDAFGSFADVADGDTRFHWYTALDGELQNGDGIDNYFGFENGLPASSIIGIAYSDTGVGAFTAGQAIIASPVPTVPLPATSLLLLAGLGSLTVMRKRSNS